MADTFFSTKEAARFLGVKPETVRYHVYVVKDLVPDRMVGKSLIFYQSTLETFKASKRSSGRPRLS